MPIQLFWIFTGVSLLVIGFVMGLISWMAREVPDTDELTQPRKLRADSIRILSYGLMIVVCLLAAMVELWMLYGE